MADSVSTLDIEARVAAEQLSDWATRAENCDEDDDCSETIDDGLSVARSATEIIKRLRTALASKDAAA